MVTFQVISWDDRDEDDKHLISIYGKTEDGRSVCVTTPYVPYFYVKFPSDWSTSDAHVFVQTLDSRCKGALVGHEFVERKDMWGFRNGELSKFVRLDCTTLKARRLVEWKIRDQFPKLEAFEANLDPVLRFMHETNIQATGWVRAEEGTNPSFVAHVDVDLWMDDWRNLEPVDRDDVAPFVIASVDIEAYSKSHKFPNPQIREDACFQIGVTLCHVGTDAPYDEAIFCFGQTTPVNGVRTESFTTEAGMLAAFRDYVHEKNVDVITGWNIFGFDFDYLYTRALMTNCQKFFNLGRRRGFSSKIVEKKLSSSALGDNVLKLLPMPGRFVYDMFQEVKKNYKLDSYKLNNVSLVYLNDSKIDMPAKEMFARFERQDPKEMSEVAEYCVKDTVLPHRICKRLCLDVNLLEMAKACWVPLSYLCERGQQIKVFSQVCKKARELGFLVKTIRTKDDPGSYVGATVLDAQKGAYYKNPITALDFASLYPSIMMAHNICYSTLVMDERYDNLPGVEYDEFQVAGVTLRYAQNVPSILPSILSDLKQFRKAAKKQMAHAEGFMKQVFDGKQLAMKIGMNSVYGATGTSVGILPCVFKGCMALAATVTTKGRSMIEDTKNYVERNFPGAVVRYGDTDSVMVEFDCGNRTGMEAIEYSWKLGEQASAGATKLFRAPNDLELEKIYHPFLLYSKKRYAAKMYEMGKSGNVEFKKIDIKGLSLVRRDTTKHCRAVCRELLDVILNSSDPQPAIDLARERAISLLTGEVPNSELILSQTLSECYKVKGEPVSVTDELASLRINQAHVAVVRKMRERRPGSEPQTGDRVPYLIVRSDDPKAKAFEKSEDPAWVEQHDLPVDYFHYFENKFSTPVSDLLEPLVEGDAKREIFGEIRGEHRPKTTRARKTKTTPPTDKEKNAIATLFKNYASTMTK